MAQERRGKTAVVVGPLDLCFSQMAAACKREIVCVRSAAKSSPASPPESLALSRQTSTASLPSDASLAPSIPETPRTLLDTNEVIAPVETQPPLTAPDPSTPPLPAVGNDQTCAEWLSVFVSTYKGTYNKFLYRLNNKMPAESKSTWKRLQETGSADEALAFVVHVFGSAARCRKKSVFSVVEDDDEVDNWVSWKVAVEQEGEQNLRAMIAAKTIRTQRHPKIPKSAAIEWPFYLQVELTQIIRRQATPTPKKKILGAVPQ